MTAELVPANLGPGLVPTGFAESILARCPDVDDPVLLWDTATTCAALAQKWNGHGREKDEIKSAQMFVEIELGQRLGQNPGHTEFHGNQHTGGYPNADNLIPAQRVQEFRRYYGYRDLLIGLVREGKRSRNALRLALDRANAVDVDAGDIDVVPGDFREVLTVEPGTVALVLTDPPYPTRYLPLWSDLGKYSADWLVPGGSLVAYCGQSILPQALDRLDAHLRYWWTFCLVNRHGTDMIPGKWVQSGWKPLLWFVNDTRRSRFMLADRIDGSAPRKTLPAGDTDDWAQGVDELEPIISGLTDPGDLIADPFAGSGTTGIAALRFGRRFIGADPVTADFFANPNWFEEMKAAGSQITVGGPGPRWARPRVRPANECAGWLGYYTRMWLPDAFDLVDIDGASPVAWTYYKAKTRTFRMFEEKPNGQTLHGSQERTFRLLVREKGIDVYVLHDAHQLGVPLFPLTITRLGPGLGLDVTRDVPRDWFDRFMLEGLYRPLFP